MPCKDTEGWLCPSTWILSPNPPPPPPPPPFQVPRCHATPSDHFDSCFVSRCCTDVRHFGCYKRQGKAYAMCLPHSQMPLDDHGMCVDTEDWQCPASWMISISPPPPPHPPPMPTRLSSPPSPPIFPHKHPRCYGLPAENFLSCHESKCCKNQHGFGCFKRVGKQYSACLPFSQFVMGGRCVDSPNWRCPADALQGAEQQASTLSAADEAPLPPGFAMPEVRSASPPAISGAASLFTGAAKVSPASTEAQILAAANSIGPNDATGPPTTGTVISAPNAAAAHGVNHPLIWIIAPILCGSLVGAHRYLISKRRKRHYAQPDTAIDTY